MVLLVAPLFNPDGGDALDPANRRLDLKKLTGQPGPVVGTRTQSHGINLNRDYLRQQAPEMRLLQAGVCQPWAPDLTIDNHATNGSVHRFHMTVDVPQDILDALTDMVESFEYRHVPIPDASEADVLRELMGANRLSQQKLAKPVGISQSTLSAVLNGGRSLTKGQVIKLAHFFHVPPAVFLPA